LHPLRALALRPLEVNEWPSVATTRCAWRDEILEAAR
jgi:hypothetical protein